MTEDLKTLKDLEWFGAGVYGTADAIGGSVIESSVLKREAVKWVKELEKIECTNHHRFCPYCEESCEGKHSCQDEDEAIAKIEFIKDFFNLSDEDLE